MADRIELVLDGQDNLSAVLDGVISKITSLSGIAGAGVAGLVTVVGAGIGAVGGVAIGTAGDIDEASAQIDRALGGTTDSAINYEKILSNIYGNNVGQGFDQIADAIVHAERSTDNLNNVTQSTIENLSQGGIQFNKFFGEDVNDVIGSATTLMGEFGLSSQQALDFLASGFQQGLGREGDFLDTITEYSVQFDEAGFSASEFYSVIETGIQGGTTLGTDRVADLVKEFQNRILDGSDAVKEALDNIGLDSDQLLSGLRDGSISVADAFETVRGALVAVEDPIARTENGVRLMGTQFEDLQAEAVGSLSTVTTSLEDMAGALQRSADAPKTLKEELRGIGREFALALEPAGDVILDLVRDSLPALKTVASSAAEAIGEVAIDVTELITGIADAFADNGLEGVFDFLEIDPLLLAGIQDVGDGLQAVFDLIATLTGSTAADGFWDFLLPNPIIVQELGLILSTIGNLVEAIAAAAQSNIEFFSGNFDAAVESANRATDAIIAAIDNVKEIGKIELQLALGPFDPADVPTDPIELSARITEIDQSDGIANVDPYEVAAIITEIENNEQLDPIEAEALIQDITVAASGRPEIEVIGAISEVNPPTDRSLAIIEATARITEIENDQSLDPVEAQALITEIVQGIADIPDFDAKANVTDVEVSATLPDLEAQARINDIDPGDFTFEYDASAAVVSVDPGEIDASHTYATTATIGEVNPGDFTYDYTTTGTVENVDFGPHTNNYDVSANVATDVDWAGWTKNYDVSANVASDVDWKSWTNNYDVSANVAQDVQWGSWTHTYSVLAEVRNVLWGSFQHTYSAVANITERVTRSVTEIVNQINPFGNAQGTDYFSGGLSYVHQGELLVAPPRGSAIVTRDRVAGLVERSLKGKEGGGFSGPPQVTVNVFGGRASDVEQGITRAFRSRGRA